MSPLCTLLNLKVPLETHTLFIRSKGRHSWGLFANIQWLSVLKPRNARMIWHLDVIHHNFKYKRKKHMFISVEQNILGKTNKIRYWKIPGEDSEYKGVFQLDERCRWRNLQVASFMTVNSECFPSKSRSEGRCQLSPSLLTVVQAWASWMKEKGTSKRDSRKNEWNLD